MFLDELTERYSREVPVVGRLPDNLPLSASELNELFNEGKDTRRGLVDLLQRSRFFLLNDAVVDDLHHLPHDATNNEATFHLPFPVMFFELINPLNIKIDTDSTKSLKGMLYGKAKDNDFHLFLNDSTRVPDDQFTVHLFYDNIVKGRVDTLPDSIFFRLSALPRLAFMSGPYFYEYSPEVGVVPTLEQGIKNILQNKYSRLVNEEMYEQLKPKNPETTRENFERLLDLCINVVDYINAHNVTIRRTERETRDIDKINRKREIKGKKLLSPLNSYYWIEVKQAEITETRAGKGWIIDYREWVRGHFQGYHTKEGILKHWIQPYIRGPPEAAWKENRYKVLDDMLRKGPRY